MGNVGRTGGGDAIQRAELGGADDALAGQEGEQAEVDAAGVPAIQFNQPVPTDLSSALLERRLAELAGGGPVQAAVAMRGAAANGLMKGSNYQLKDDQIRNINIESKGIDLGVEMGLLMADGPLKDALYGDPPQYLDVSAITPEMVRSLPPDDRAWLMNTLAQTSFQVEIHYQHGYYDAGGGNLPFAGSMDGAQLLTAMMAHAGGLDALAALYAAAPATVLPLLNKEQTAAVANRLPSVLEDMGTDQLTPDELDSLGNLVAKNLELSGEKDPAKVRAALQAMLDQMAKTKKVSPENAGVIMGAMVSGMMKYFDKVKLSEDARNKAIDEIAGLAAKGAGKLPPPLGNVVSFGLKEFADAYKIKDETRRRTEVATRMQGAMELALLQDRTITDDQRQNAILWLKTTLLNNGIR